ncbi:hypothetical protein E4V60_10980 [Proteus mirabilis]|nr:hypothetical protein E4V60_10980 [Proteus mirabilis]
MTEDGGSHNKGFIEAEFDIKPDLWFFDCHFVNDPVMPGRSKEQCPYFAIDARSHWLGGWRQAMEDRPGLAK